MLNMPLNDYEILEQVDFFDQIASGFFQKPKDLSFRMRMCTAAGCLAEVHGWSPLPQYGYLPAFLAKSWGIVLHLVRFSCCKKTSTMYHPCLVEAFHSNRDPSLNPGRSWGWTAFRPHYPHLCPCLGIFQETGEIDIQKVPFKDRITIEAMQKYLQTLGDTRGCRCG